MITWYGHNTPLHWHKGRTALPRLLCHCSVHHRVVLAITPETLSRVRHILYIVITYYHAATTPRTQWAYTTLEGALENLLKNTGISVAGSEDNDITPTVLFGKLAAKFSQDPMGTLAAVGDSLREVK